MGSLHSLFLSTYILVQYILDNWVVSQMDYFGINYVIKLLTMTWFCATIYYKWYPLDGGPWI